MNDDNAIDWSQVDWKKLNDFNIVISNRIKKRMPADYSLSFDEIKSEVNAAFVQLIKAFKPMTNGLSLTSWCYQYAEKIAFGKIMREYKRLKKQIQFEEVFSDKYSDDTNSVMKHQYGKCYDLLTSIIIDHEIEAYDLLENISKIYSSKNVQIIKMRFLQQMTQQEIAKKLNVSQVAVSKHLAKCIQKIKSIRNF